MNQANKYIPAGIEEGHEVVEIEREPVEEARRDVPRVSDLEKEKERGSSLKGREAMDG